MAFIDCSFPLEVFLPGEPIEDRFGNTRPGPGSWVEILVASWWVHKTEEKGDDSILRTVDYLTAHFPAGDEPTSAAKIRIPGESQEWQVVGNVEDYNHGWHGFVPGLVVVNAKNVEG